MLTQALPWVVTERHGIVPVFGHLLYEENKQILHITLPQGQLTRILKCLR